MRKLVAALVVGMGLLGFASQAMAYDENDMPPGLEKFSRGALDVALGFPEEVVTHTIGAATEHGTDSLGGWIGSTASGVFIGAFWGVARIGSGFIDMFTFPVPFNDNHALVEPDNHI